MANIQGHIVEQAGSLDHFPTSYHCSKCDARFKVRKDSVQPDVEHVSGCFVRDVPYWKVELIGYTRNGVITKQMATCPTKGCGERLQIEETRTGDFLCCCTCEIL